MRTWIEIDMDAIRKNYEQACRMTKAEVTAVLKSNAYGHGAVQVASMLEACGCRSFAVSSIREAMELRNHHIQSEILVMGASDEEEVLLGVQHEIILTVGSMKMLRDAANASRSLNKTVQIELKVDSGFHRLGFPCEKKDLEIAARELKKNPGVAVHGVYSHLGLITSELDQEQNRKFLNAVKLLQAFGVEVPQKHLCDSIGLVRYPQWHYDRVRTGAFLFGVRPSRSEKEPFEDLETLCMKAVVLQVHDVPKGETVGYSDDQVTERNSRIATLSAGYGDGYPRMLSNGAGKVLIRGKRCPVVGLVCMDQMMVDVTDTEGVQEGDEAILLGKGIRLDEYAAWAKTNRNECLARLSARPVRKYYSGGVCVQERDDLE